MKRVGVLEELGTNRTGVDMSPRDADRMVEAARDFPPSAPADGAGVLAVLADRVKQGDRIGGLPPPATLRGVVKTAASAVVGRRPTVLLDKLGERIGYERGGVRLYELMIAKLDAAGTFDGGPTREELVRIHDEEANHFELAFTAMRKIGGDPTALTPAADVHEVLSSGIFQVVGDARTSLPQSLDAILAAELVDNDAWELLIQLADELGEEELRERFRAARTTELEHLVDVRRWVAAAARLRAGPAAA